MNTMPHSDEAPKTASGDPDDHLYWPSDPKVRGQPVPSLQKEEAGLVFTVLLLGLRGSSHCLLMKQCLLAAIISLFI